MKKKFMALLLVFALVAGVVVSPVGMETVKAGLDDTWYTSDNWNYVPAYYDRDSIYIISNTSDDEVIEIPQILAGKPVIGIGRSIINTPIGFLVPITCKKVVIPSSVKEIAGGIRGSGIQGEGVTEISVDVDNPNYASEYGALYDKTKTRLITYPQGAADVKLSSNITNIEDYAFQCCRNLISINIPNSVTSIGINAFMLCNSLTDIYYGGSQEQWENIKTINWG